MAEGLDTGAVSLISGYTRPEDGNYINNDQAKNLLEKIYPGHTTVGKDVYILKSTKAHKQSYHLTKVLMRFKRGWIRDSL